MSTTPTERQIAYARQLQADIREQEYGMNGHDQDCDGHCGWNRTLCDEQWRVFLQRMTAETDEE